MRGDCETKFQRSVAWTLYIVYLCALIEIAFQGYYFVLSGEVYSPQLIASRYSRQESIDTQPLASAKKRPQALKYMVQHPYFGFTLDDVTITGQLYRRRSRARYTNLLRYARARDGLVTTKKERDAFTWTATNDVPRIAFPGFTVDKLGTYLIVAEMAAPGATYATVFLTKAGANLPNLRQSRLVSRERKKILFVFDVDGEQQFILRFDFGRLRGTYRVWALSLYKYEPRTFELLYKRRKEGFPHNKNGVDMERRSGTIRVLLTGGSVAARQGYGGAVPVRHGYGGYLEAALNRKLSAHTNKRVKVFAAAVGGFKQPQQLFVAGYMLTRGVKFDILINLDGFNEVVLPWQDNIRFGVAGIYPRQWGAMQSRKTELRTMLQYARLHALKDQEHKLISSVEHGLLYRSALAGFIADTQLKRLDKAIRSIEVNPYVASSESYEVRGSVKSLNRTSALNESVNIWSNASLSMWGLAKQWNIEYYHALQPNQYVPGSKPFTMEEKRRYINLRRGYGPIARDGYPLLRARGKNLADKGLQFIDATMIFSRERKTVYLDACCHLNDVGRERLADFIATEVAKRSKYFQTQ